jgi:diacylglycerol kinase family enzyme
MLNNPENTEFSGDDALRQRTRARAIINGRAGTAMGIDGQSVTETLKAVLGDAGYEIDIEHALPETIEGAIKSAAASDIDVLIVGGGDGTIRTAARHLMGTDKALGILPLGTMNRLAKDLAIPLDLPSAAAALARARPTKIDVATVNDEIFLCNSVMGATLRYSFGRARLRGRPAHERLPRYFGLIRDILGSRRKLSIVVDHGEERLRIRAMSVVVANNGYDERPGALRRPDLAGGQLTMYVSKHRSGWGLAKSVARALLGRWQGDPEMMKLVGREFAIHARNSRKWLANDGELSRFSMPLRYASLPRALTVLVPEP